MAFEFFDLSYSTLVSDAAVGGVFHFYYSKKNWQIFINTKSYKYSNTLHYVYIYYWVNCAHCSLTKYNMYAMYKKSISYARPDLFLFLSGEFSVQLCTSALHTRVSIYTSITNSKYTSIFIHLNYTCWTQHSSKFNLWFPFDALNIHHAMQTQFTSIVRLFMRSGMADKIK